MAIPRITVRTAYDSPETLVFRCQKSRRNSNDITPNGGVKWRWGRFESADFYHRTTLPLRRSTAATLYSSAMTDANDAFTVAERYRPTAINNVRSKSITGVVYINSRCASTVPSALAELLVNCGVWNSNAWVCASLWHVVLWKTICTLQQFICVIVSYFVFCVFPVIVWLSLPV